MSNSTLRPLVVLIMVLLGFVFGHAQTPFSVEPIVVKSMFPRTKITPKATTQPLVLTGLTVGETYYMVVTANNSNNANCIPIISTGQIENSSSSGSGMTFAATAKDMHLTLTFPCTWPDNNAPQFTLSVQKKLDKPNKLFNTPDEVLEVSVLDAEAVVRDVLIGGNCFDISGVTYCGGGEALGQFFSGTTNIGFEKGMVMCTGPITVAPGPNTADGAGGSAGSCGPDSDLAALSSGAQNDVARLEFDFRPTVNQVVFEYVFASEEYCEYVGSQFNDVFGFFISGPGIPGGVQNLAVIPTTTIPVAINNINHLSFPGFFVNNQPASSGNLCLQTAATGPGTTEVQFDGYTRKFIARATVQPCQTYHIKLVIADIGDAAFDSGVFIRDGSFDAGGNASVEWLVNDEPGTEVYEGCGNAGLLFDRVGGNVNLPLNVSYTISGTATSGLDFTPIPGSIVIPPGQEQFYLPVNILTDLLVEGVETITITLTNLCSCSMPSTTLNINDLQPLMTMPDTVVICGSGFATLQASATGGVPDYTYNWQAPGGTGIEAMYFVASSGNYKVTITDDCGQTKVQNIYVKVKPLPKAQLLPPAPQLCDDNDTGFLTVNFIGVGPFELVYSLNGSPQDPISDITTNPFLLEVSEIGLYQIASIMDADGCIGTGAGAQLVINSLLNITGVPTNVQCSGQGAGAINTTVTGGQGPYTYQWQGPQTVPNVPDPVNLVPGTYAVTVTDGFMCTRTGEYTIQAATVITPTLTQASTPNCINPNGGAVNLTLSGGNLPYTFKWSTNANTQNIVGVPAGTYTVTITDATGCTGIGTINVVGDLTPPLAVGTAANTLDCQIISTVLDGQGSSVGNNMGYLWTAQNGSGITGPSNTLNTTVNAIGTYRLRVTNNTNGCTAIVDVPVTGNTTPPVASAGLPQTLSCAITNVTLDGSGSSSSGNNISYLWSASNGGVIAGGANTTQPIVSAVGTYTILVTNLTNFCTSTASVTVNQNVVPPSAAVAPASVINCVNNQITLNANGSTPSNVAFSWFTLNGNIISGNTSANPVVSEAGTYTVTVTNPGNGCSNTASVNVTEDQTIPNVIAFSNQDLDCTHLTTTVTGQNPSNDGNPVWVATQGGNIVSGQGSLSITVNQPGLYTLTVTNPVSQCSASASKLINEDITPPPAVVGAPATLTCYNSNLLTLGDPNAIPFNTTFQWTASNGGVISGPANQSTINVNNSGTYVLNVTNTFNGCTNQASVSISQDITPPTATVAPANQINCTNSFVQLSGTGSVGPIYAYQWTTVNGSIQVGANTLTPVVTTAGNYQLLVTNNVNGCTTTASATVISDLNLPNFDIAPANAFTCNTQQLPLSATVSSAGTFNLQWGTADGTILSGGQTLAPTVGGPGTYTLIVTNPSNNCSAAQSVIVAANNVPPVVSAGSSQTLSCSQPTLTLNGNAPGAGHTYNWAASAGGNIVTGSNSLSPAVDEPGVYTLTVINSANGCSSTASVQVLQDAGQPVVALATPAPLTCLTQQLAINGANSSVGSNFVFGWSGPGIISGENTSTPTVNQPGNYILTITNTANGCTTTGTATVLQDIVLPTADAGPAQVLNCINPQFQIGGTNMSVGPNFIYDWSGPGLLSGGNSQQPIIGQPGTYTVTVTNTTNGCTQVGGVAIDANFATPAVDAGPNGLLTCIENFYVAQPGITGTGPFEYLWQTTAGSVLSGSNTPNATLNGAGTYYLIVTNIGSGCTATDQLQVFQSSDFPNANAGSSDVLTCATQQITLDGTSSSQNGPFIYNWILVSGGNIVSGGNTLEPIINEPGTYRLEVRDTTNTCISYSEVTINQNIEPPVVDAGIPVTLTCSVNAVTLQGSVSTNGSFIYDWTASNGGNIVTGGFTPTPSVNAVGVYTLLITNTLNGCTATDQVNVLNDINAPTVAITNPDTLNCIVKELVLSTSGSSTNNVTYAWTTPNGNIVDMSDSTAVKIDKPGVYQLVIQNMLNNCASLASVTVVQDIAAPMANAGSTQELDCNTIIATLDGAGSSTNGSFFYQWDTPNGEILAGRYSLTPTVTAAGSYILTVINNLNGCKSTDVVNVQEDIQQPNIVIVIPALITCFSPEVVLDGSTSTNGSNFSYSWTTPNGNILSGETDLQTVVNAPGSYTLTILNNDNGCANASTTLVDENTVAPSVLLLPAGTINCSDPVVGIIAIAENGTQYSFGWSTTDGNIVGGENSLQVKVDEPGTYSVLVVNNSNGCATIAQTDVIEVTERPEGFEYSFKVPGCKDNDGQIKFDTVIGGISPYLYSIDGGNTFRTSIVFSNVAPGFYDLIIQDANGCEYVDTLTLNLPKAIDPDVNLDPQVQLQLGDELTLEAVLPLNFPKDLIDTVIWNPTLYLDFGNNTLQERLEPICRPFNSIQYTVTIITKNGGCEAQDRITILVDAEPKIYIPNVFTPDNTDDENGVFYIFADDKRKQIKQINSFQIFDRWGEMVHQATNFQPNDPSYGWKGQLGSTGKPLTPAVFVYYAVIELIDGRILLYEGDVTLVR